MIYLDFRAQRFLGMTLRNFKVIRIKKQWKPRQKQLFLKDLNDGKPILPKHKNRKFNVKMLFKKHWYHGRKAGYIYKKVGP